MSDPLGPSDLAVARETIAQFWKTPSPKVGVDSPEFPAEMRAQSWAILASQLLATLDAAQVAQLTSERDHYLAGCVCPQRAWCVPHGWTGTDRMHHQICADHDHVDPAARRASDAQVAGLREAAQALLDSTDSYREVAGVYFIEADRLRAALAATPAPQPAPPLDMERLADALEAERAVRGVAQRHGHFNAAYWQQFAEAIFARLAEPQEAER